MGVFEYEKTANRLFAQQLIRLKTKEIMLHIPDSFWGEFIADQWIHPQRASNAETFPMSWRHQGWNSILPSHISDWSSGVSYEFVDIFFFTAYSQIFVHE